MCLNLSTFSPPSPSLPHPSLSLIAGTLLLVFPGRLEHAELLLHIEGLMAAGSQRHHIPTLV